MADFFKFGKEYDETSKPVEPGMYEVKLESVEPKVSKKSGKNFWNCTFRIRDDVDQNFKGRSLYYVIMQNDNDRHYNFGKVNKIVCSQPLDNYPEVETIDQLLFYLNSGLLMKVKVENEFNDSTGTEYAKINDKEFFLSEVPVNSAKLPDDSVELPDDDLPF